MVDLPEDTILSHASKGRLRLRIPSKRRNSAYFETISSELEKLSGLTQIQVNPMSGSILILYSELPAEMTSWLQRYHGLTMKNNIPVKSDLVQRKITGTFDQLNNRIRGFTNGELDIQALSFLALVVVGIYQISRGNFTAPAWYTAFWYAMNIFLKSKE
jgi:hypothetical protein